MMKKTKSILLAGLTAALFSCQKEQTQSVVKAHPEEKVTPEKAVEPEVHQELYGIYSGDFRGPSVSNGADGVEYYDEVPKKLSLKINRITKDSVYGHSIVGGNQRPFRGVFREQTGTFVLDEPGNDKTDGRFEVKISGDSLTGKWVAFQSGAVKSPRKTVKLVRREFAYNSNFMLQQESDLVDWQNPKEFEEKYTDPETHETQKYKVEKQRVASEAVFKLNASTQKLTEAQLKNLRKLDIQIIKNSVFARHGYAFKKDTFRYFFEQTDWYIPVSDNVEKDLTPLEKENIALLARFEQYAEDHYDQFGR